MNHLKSFALPTLLAAALLLSGSAAAQEITVQSTESFCFSSADFTAQPHDEGIFVTAVPSSRIATVSYGGRILQAGDALPLAALDQLTLQSRCVTKQTAAVEYYTVSDGKVSGRNTMQLSILPKKNEAPTAEDASLETYRNIPNSGQLKASDPENDTLTYSLMESPRRGTVELREDGSFTYTPQENKVGKDRFSFLVTDEAGNCSAPAQVTIQIKKPADKTVYADMAEDADAFSAMWMKERELFTGSTIGGQLCFSPEQPVSRGEFLVMVMKLVEADAAQTTMHTGFSDEQDTPAWLRPYLTAALRNGMISGVQSEEGVAFLADSHMTQAEAAVMLQNILQLPVPEAAAVFAPADNIPVWAEEAAAALSGAGVTLQITGETAPLTRRDAAKLLYHVDQLMQTEAVSALYRQQ